jgi:hypothetical protein
MTRRGVALDLEALRRELQEARENEKPNTVPSLRDAIGVLLPEIEGLRRAKWTDAQIAEWLGKRKLVISPGTLAQYIREARRAASATEGEAKPKRAAKLVSSTPPSVAPSSPPSVPPAKAARKTEHLAEVPKAVPDTKTETLSAPPATRTPNAAAAIPAGKRRVQDDA